MVVKGDNRHFIVRTAQVIVHRRKRCAIMLIPC